MPRVLSAKVSRRVCLRYQYWYVEAILLLPRLTTTSQQQLTTSFPASPSLSLLSFDHLEWPSLPNCIGKRCQPYTNVYRCTLLGLVPMGKQSCILITPTAKRPGEMELTPPRLRKRQKPRTDGACFRPPGRLVSSVHSSASLQLRGFPPPPRWVACRRHVSSSQSLLLSPILPVLLFPRCAFRGRHFRKLAHH
jgi:hypothetical protein